MVDDLTHIGTVTAVNPARRELRVTIDRGREEKFEEIEWIRLELRGGEAMRCRVSKARINGDTAIVALAAGVTRDAVSRMKGSAVVSLNPGHRSDSFLDFVGFDVLAENGTRIGEIVGVLETKAHPVLEIDCKAGGSMLVPAIEQVILEIDRDARRIVVSDLAPYAVENETGEGTRLV